MQRFTLVLPDDLYRKLLEVKHQKKMAGSTQANMSDIVREALETYLENSTKREREE